MRSLGIIKLTDSRRLNDCSEPKKGGTPTPTLACPHLQSTLGDLFCGLTLNQQDRGGGLKSMFWKSFLRNSDRHQVDSHWYRPLDKDVKCFLWALWRLEGFYLQLLFSQDLKDWERERALDLGLNPVFALTYKNLHRFSRLPESPQPQHTCAAHGSLCQTAVTPGAPHHWPVPSCGAFYRTPILICSGWYYTSLKKRKYFKHMKTYRE